MLTLWQHRDLVSSLVRRQYQLRYRQSLAGFMWALIPPLASLFAATLVFDKVAGIDTGSTPYPLFAFAALAPWTFFANGLSFGVPSVVSAQQMVSRLRFPRAAIPIGAVGTSLIDLVVASTLFVVFAYATGAGLPITALWFPVFALIEIVLVTGLVLFGSALNIFARDIRLAIPLIVQLWLFVTPVFYPLADVPSNLRPLYLLNPMTGLVESFRRALIYGLGPDPGLLVPATAGAIVSLVIGAWYFSATEQRFADVI
jgi:lipopolysaccharide transport system permease protein